MINISNEDNMVLMARYPDNYFDLAIVDPPYGISYARGKNGWGVNDNRPKLKDVEWDKETPNQEYFNELIRVSKNQIICGGNYFTDKIPVSKCWIVWNKINQTDNKSVFADAELLWTSFTKVVKMFTLRTMGFINDTKDKYRIHPTQKPTELYEWILMNYATCKTCNNEGGYYEDVAGDGGSQMFIACEDCYKEDTDTNEVRILDTHLGSGSIAIACHNLKFDLTACELDKEYYDSAVKRLKEHQQQLTMF